MPWIVVFWCFAHRLELALNDALRTTYFSKVEELLLRLYYFYEKSPKKCRELNVVTELTRRRESTTPSLWYTFCGPQSGSTRSNN